mmetsp:Transcript_45039/g.70605  ORF Transcript_45039/g.70605 Transcript_45039/m.70605 type:complete len:547 (+) Transcript_45039:189-1829(+)|eukprot:CAMPEP_0184288166 /NCGR_PEP_ID=MMETSP1049-20130417/665_1 /TAXON_ID=77928 /ORGANISM="Proteomonas sulcata, Strain CCMP704" /LENGTH=546 /DNA_ID=CAMNT_0026594397 /DNA_START=124 /DNA_END=1764 /DNA_ORIENTATION=-
MPRTPGAGAGAVLLLLSAPFAGAFNIGALPLTPKVWAGLSTSAPGRLSPTTIRMVRLLRESNQDAVNGAGARFLSPSTSLLLSPAARGPLGTPMAQTVRKSRFGLKAGSWAVPDEDDWVGSDNWDSFRKSNARRRDAQAKEEDKAREEQKQGSQQQTWDNDETDGLEKDSGRGWSEQTEWLKIAGCDVCLPKDKRKPLDGDRFTGVVHFIGGAFLGVVPKQAYRVLIEGLVAKARVVVIATPCSGLAGMDHYKAAYEAAFKFQGAAVALQGELGKDVFYLQDYPVIGVGHSLGCKVQLLVNSVPDARGAIERSRAANVFLAFNNYGAKESIPVLTQLNKVQQEVTKGIASAAPVFDRISSFATTLKESPEFKDALGTPEASKGLEFLTKLSDFGKKAAANVQSEVAEEFSPAPEDTFQLLRREYDVGRNLVVKFLDDTIDQSVDLCVELRDKFTDKEKGIGGRLDLKRLAGSHVTPNTPDLENLENSPINNGLGNMEEFSTKKAKQIMEEVDALADTVAIFLKEEAQRDRIMPKSTTRLASAEDKS